MTKQTQANKTQADPKNNHKSEAQITNEIVNDLPGQTQWLGDSLGAIDDRSIQAQTARLDDRRLLTAQRLALAGRIGRVQGNRHLQRVVANTTQSAGITVQRASPNGKAGTPPAQTPSKKLSEEEQKKKEEFRKRPINTFNFVPANGSGKFDAKYNPATGEMAVIVKIYFDFQEKLPADEKNKAILQSYEWTLIDKLKFMIEFMQHAMSRWSGKYVFSCTKPGWEDIRATPQVSILIADSPAEAHFHATITKVGEGMAGQHHRSGVNAKEHNHQAEGEHDEDKPRTADFHSPDNTDKQDFQTQDIVQAQSARMFSALSGNGVTWIAFNKGRTDVPTNKKSALQKAATEMPQLPPGAPPLPLLVIGSRKAGEPAELAQKRAQSVKAVLEGAGVTSPIMASGKEEEDEAGVTIGVGDLPAEWKNKYNVSEHEFGHMLGNPDEYVTRPDYDTTAWEELVKKANVRVPTMREWTTSQMSGGSDILPAHYVTMWDALGLMTTGYIEPSEWKIG